ncbi:P63C domain-containing protein [Halalkalibacterium halodurans]|uniref:P63C domain-containing protein n=1 Tax=Halalkalibacterium halodurans TaxID=86665 RepID=UPI002AA9DB95|nr:P63C domain-containing protein [Halalkalibacterium halodurans]MDY7224511.1 P63C domain-containing protein [Halalkalibacterium halodurans]MDY7243796.1 P63C domain-containing protein [Halalkalibacterium halodurans]
MTKENHEIEIKHKKNQISTDVIRATHKGDWVPTGTDLLIECYVLENQERVFSLRGTARTMGLKGNGAGALQRLLKSNYIRDYLSADLKQWVKDTDEGKVQKIRPPEGGNLIHGFKASLLVDLSDAFYKAKNDGVFDIPARQYQNELADRLYNITLAFSKVGIDAFIDEITGYQDTRDRDALQKLLDIYVEDYFQPWQKRFPDSFYKEIFRLKGWEYKANGRKPHLVSKITREFIYDFLPPDVMDEVRERKKGKEKIHQWLTSEAGLNHLEKQIASTTTLMRASESWEEFEKLFGRSFKKNYSEQQSLFE